MRTVLFTALVLALPSIVAGASLPSGFRETVVFRDLTKPTAVRFSPDGRVFVAEKSGLIKVFDSVDDPAPTIFADLRTNVHNFWDRGLSSLALHPDFPNTPFVYVGYTLDAEIGGTPPRWGTAGATNDGCPNPPGASTDGCVVAGRLSRLQANGNVMTGPEEVLIEDWCQQFPSHSVDSLVFGADGALYVSAGDGASFFGVDYGQFGIPRNPCGDPPAGIGGMQMSPTAEGGSLRSQSLRRATGEPAVFNGAVLRIDPSTGTALPDNPLSDSGIAKADAIVAYGLRNPYRMTVRPGSNEIWIGDVGWNNWEEIDRIIDPRDALVENFGWPCYEGPGRQPSFDAQNLTLCESLYATPNVAAPFYSYHHNDHIVSGETCSRGSSSITGLAFYTGDSYPAEYKDALFFADYSRNCIWALFKGADGLPSPVLRTTFIEGAAAPVDLQVGPGGDLFYVDLTGGTIRRIEAVSQNQPPTVVLVADREVGPVPLIVQFDATASTDGDGDELSFTWDLDGDGEFDDADGSRAQYTYTAAVDVTVRVRVTDSRGAETIAERRISAGNTAPVAVIHMPLATSLWSVGEVIAFQGSASDAEEGTLPETSLSWSLLLQHCPSNCHTHPLQSFVGVASGEFDAPDHDYPTFLELQLTATDSRGVVGVASVRLDPRTVALTFESSPPGFFISSATTSGTTPFVATAIVGSVISVAAPAQAVNGISYGFESWSDGGAQNHDLAAPEAPAAFVAKFAPIPGAVCGNGVLDPGEQCDDANVAPGDCCSPNCQIEAAAPCDLASLGTIIARVTEPTGSGNRNIEVIRDGDKPPVGSGQPQRQYDTNDGVNEATEDWIGYVYARPQVFSRVVFQEGVHTAAGGWFETLGVEVRQEGVWQPVTGSIAPTYPGYDDDINFESYTIDLDELVGDGIRIFGRPGGSSRYISVGELEVFGGVIAGAVPPTPTPNTGGTPTSTEPAVPTATATPVLIRLSGAVFTAADDAALADTDVEIEGPANVTVKTNEDGEYEAAGLAIGLWHVTARRTDAPGTVTGNVAGLVSTLFVRGAHSEVQQLSCDVTGDAVISVADLMAMVRKDVGALERFEVAEACDSDWAFLPDPRIRPGVEAVTPRIAPGSCDLGRIDLDATKTNGTDLDFAAVRFGDCRATR